MSATSRTKEPTDAPESLFEGGGPSPAVVPQGALGGELPDAVFFGCLEGFCFFCLFVMPFLSLVDPLSGWLAVALLRATVLGAVCLPGRSARTPVVASGTVAFLKQGLLYQLPFWSAALLFPLQPGQTQHALLSLLLQLALLSALPLLRAWTPWLGAETAVYLLSCGWLAVWQPVGGWLAIAALGLPLSVRRPSGHRCGDWQATKGQALAVGSVWLVALVLPRLTAASMRSSDHTLLLWSLLLFVGCAAFALQRASRGHDEVEESLPALVAARSWLLRRQIFAVTAGWLALPLLISQGAQEWLAYALLWGACWRAAELAARCRLREETLGYWMALEMTLVWGALQLELYPALGCCAVSLLWGLALTATAKSAGDEPVRPTETTSVEPALSAETTGSEPASLPALEQALRDGLRCQAPPGLAAKVLEEAGSVELDKDLAAAAPAGFRQRLLQRLRESDNQE